MIQRSQDALDATWQGILTDKYAQATVRPERIPSESGKDIMSIPNDLNTARQVYERTQGGPWKEVPFISHDSAFK